MYLTAAYELRHGTPTQGISLSGAVGLLRQTPMPRFLEALAARLDGPEADGRMFTLNLVIPDEGPSGETYVLSLENAVLHHRRDEPDPSAHTTLRVTRALLMRLLAGEAGARELVFGDELDVDGSRLDLLAFLRLLDPPEPTFPIVTP